MTKIEIKPLLEAGVHFGHLTRKWNPNMAPYIFMEKNGIHIINLYKTASKIEECAQALNKIALSGRKILFVATKKQAKEIAQNLLVAKNPRMHVGKLRTPSGIKHAINLAELSGSSVRTSATAMSMSFPEHHPQCGKGHDINYDYILGLESDGSNTSIRGPSLLSNAENRDLTDIGFGFIREPVIPPRRNLLGDKWYDIFIAGRDPKETTLMVASLGRYPIDGEPHIASGPVSYTHLTLPTILLV